MALPPRGGHAVRRDVGAPTAPPWVAFLGGVVLLLLVSGCGGDGRVLSSWTLHVEGAASTVELPIHLEDRLPVAMRGLGAAPYHLTTATPLDESLRGRTLTLTFTRFPALPVLRVGGEIMVDRSVADWDRYRSAGPHAFVIPPRLTQGATLELDLEVPCTWIQAAWVDSAPRLSPSPGGDRAAVLRRLSESVTGAAAASILAFGSLAYLLIFLQDRRRREHGWYAMEGIAGTYYPLFTMGATQPLLGVYDAPLLGVAIPLTIYGAMRFGGSYLGMRAPPRWVTAVLMACMMAGVVVAFAPVTTSRPSAFVVAAGVTILMAYQTTSLIRFARRTRTAGIGWLFASLWIIMAVLLTGDVGAWLGFGDGPLGCRAASCGALAFIGLMQVALLGRDHVARIKEVELLNEELRAKVAARSHELTEALGRMSETGALPPVLSPGDVFAGRYRVVKGIGAGGMGHVYEVERLRGGTRLALKVLGRSATGPLLSRFAREAQLLAQVHHPNVVDVVDVDLSPEGILYLVMEYVDGASLHRHKERFGEVPWALGVLLGVARGLAAVHKQGIVHRDLKPANVLVSATGEVKIADFGIASLVGEALGTVPSMAMAVAPLGADAPTRKLAAGEVESVGSMASFATRRVSERQLTRTGEIMGTPLYIAPELQTGMAQAGAPADVFSFGVVAFEIVSGQLPFTEPPVLARLMGRPAPGARSLAEVCPALPAPLAALLQECLDETPRRRPTAEALVTALEKVVPEAS